MFGMLPFERHSDNLFQMMDRLQREMLGGTSGLPDFRTDIREDGDHYVLDAELPGFQKEDISLDVKDNVLTISAQHQESQDQKDDQGNYLRRERRFGSFRRSFDVSGIDVSGITAAYNSGVLTLNLPKAQPAVDAGRRIAIE